MIESIQKKREILTRTRRSYVFPKNVQNRSKTIPRCVFHAFRVDLLGIRFRKTPYARGKDGIVRKRRFFVCRECNPRQHLEAFGHVLGQKKRKKELTPLTPLSLTQKILHITNNNTGCPQR